MNLILKLFTFTFHFHALEKEMATHSSVLAWRIPGTGEPGGLTSMGSHRVRHDWSDLAVSWNRDPHESCKKSPVRWPLARLRDFCCCSVYSICFLKVLMTPVKLRCIGDLEGSGALTVKSDRWLRLLWRLFLRRWMMRLKSQSFKSALHSKH